MRTVLLGILVLFLVTGCGGEGEQATTADGCESVERPAPREPETSEQPTAALDSTKSNGLSFDTTCGSFTVALDLDAAPNAAASLVALSEAGYFDDTIFHRIADFAIQGGDPTQRGNGGPGYSTVDPPPENAAYTKGVFAMAKTAIEAPGTAGSQFFVVTVADAGLPPDYAIVGEVTEGLDVVERIGQLGDANEQPTQPVVIRTVTVSES